MAIEVDDKDVSLYNGINISDDQNTINISFAAIKNFKAPKIEIADQVVINIAPKTLKGIVKYLIDYGVKYQDKYNVDIGFGKPKENK
jgi:hypothetical protein